MFKITKSSGRCLEKVIKLQNIRSNCQLLNPTQSRSLYVVTYAINTRLPVDKSIICNLSLLPKNVREFHTSLSLGQDSQVVNCPAFADSISEGDIKWSKAVGDSVKEDDVVAEIETDKTSIQVPAPGPGVIEELIAPEGSTVKPGMPLFRMKAGAGGGGGGSAPAPKPAAAAPPPPPPPKAAAPPPPAASAPQPPPPPPPQQQQQQQQAPPPRASPPPSQPPPAPTPAAKPMAAQKPPVQVPPAASVRVPPADPTKEISGTRTEQRVKMSRMRMRISQRLKDAQNINAMLTTFNEIDMTNIMQMRKEHGEMFLKKHNIKLGFMSAFVRGAAYALQELPTVNAVIDPSGGEIIYRDYIDISVAVASPKGLVVPVLRSVERMGYADIEKALAAVAEKARTGALAIEDMDGGTFTISNGGVFGSLFGTPIINPPQSAILGMHAINEKPVAIKGQVVIRPIMVVALTYDHRLIDGREAVTFLKTIKNSVEDPRSFLLGL